MTSRGRSRRAIQRSTRRATIGVASSTAAEDDQRVQEGGDTRVRRLVEREGFPAREALVDAVPEAISCSPTCQQSSTSSPSSRAGKSTRPVSRSFTRTPSRSDAGRLRDHVPLALDLLVQLAGLLRVEIAAVPGIRAVNRARRSPRGAAPAGARPSPRRAAAPSRAARSPPRGEVAPGHAAIIARRVRRSTVRSPKRTARRELRLPRARNPVPEMFLWTRLAIWAAALFSLFVFVPEPPSAGGDLGRPEADARSRRGHRRLGPLGQRLVPPHRGARLRLGHGRCGGLLPALPGDGGAARPRALRPLRARRDPHLAGRLARRVPAPLPDRRGAARRRRRAAGRALPRLLPVRAVPPGRLQRVALPAADARRVPARRAPPLPRSRRRRRARAADEAGRGRAAAGAGAARVAGAERVRALASLAVAPLLFAAYPLYLWAAEGDPWGFLHAQRLWSRHLSPAGPLGGIWDGLRAGWAGVEQLASGSHTHVYWTPVQDSDPIRAAGSTSRPRLPRALRRARP